MFVNRQRFLAELRRLLVFMSDEDREEAVRRCAAAFDAAGPEGETDLISALGSPTKTAIALSRGYEPGTIPDVFPAVPEKAQSEPEPEAAPEPAPEEDPLALPPEPPVDWIKLPGEEDAAPAEDTLPAEDVPPTDAPPPADAGDEEETPAPEEPEAPEAREEPEEPKEDEEPVYVIERSMPLGLGIPLFILVFVALGIPLAVLCLALSLVLLAPGCAVLFGAYLVFVGGLWCMNYMADAVLLFGLTAVVLAVGLLVLWLGLWLAVLLWRLYGKGVGWIAGELLGRKVIEDA